MTFRKTKNRSIEPRNLDLLVWPGAGGSRHGPAPEDDNEPERRSDLLTFLLKFVGGCEKTLDLLLQIFDEQITQEQLAHDFGVHRTNVIRGVNRFLRRCKTAWTSTMAMIAHRLLRATGGATVNPLTAEAFAPADAWFVSLKGFESRARGYARVSVIASYIEAHASILFTTCNTHLGLWFDPATSETCLDLTRVYLDKSAALAAAEGNGQKAITHARTLETIWLDQLDEPRRAA